MVHVSAPGKLMIAGEWAVLEGYPCIVAAVNRRAHATLEPKSSEEAIEIILKDFDERATALFHGGKLVILKGDTEKMKFAKAAVETALQYLGDARSFRLTSWNDTKDKKIGFGSSAAATVAIISGILAFNGVKIDTEKSKLLIFKLSTISHYKAQGKIGSGFDVAASSFGGVIVYRRFDQEWLEKHIDYDVRKLAN